MKYFLVNGYIPSAHPPVIHEHGYSDVGFGRNEDDTRDVKVRRYQEAGIAIPRLGETIFLRHPKIGRISLFVYGAYDAFIMIASSSQRNGYLLGNALRATITCFYGHAPLDQGCGYLLELSKIPDENLSHKNLVTPILTEASRYDEGLLRREPVSGTHLNHFELQEGCAIVGKALNYPWLIDVLLHLEYSMSLVWGFMVGSYYESHYKRDRKKLSRYQMERTYLENRFRYDAAFVSAFRGVECVLGKPHFKKGQIPTLLSALDAEFGTDFSKSRHRSWHEVFSSRRRWWEYGDILSYYLTLRNAVSAHGNPSPPHIVMEDQVLEIQYLLADMLNDIFSGQKKTEQVVPQ